MNSNSLGIARGWQVITSDGKRVGDVVEVHPHYLLVSRGVLVIRDMYLPLGSVERAEQKTVYLSVTQSILRGMDLSHEPPPPPVIVETPIPLVNTALYDGNTYVPEPSTGDNDVSWQNQWTIPEPEQPYEETPSYTRPQLNGLVEVEPTVNLAIQDFGYGSSILLMQGWPFDSSIWEPLPTLLAEDHRVVTYDPRGLGQSDRPWDFYSVEMHAADVHRLIVEQSLRDITIVAWSSAALVALQYAREHPGRVSRLVLLNPLVPIWLADEALLEQLHLEPELNQRTQEFWRQELLNDRAAQHERLLDRLTHTPLSGHKRQWLWQRLMHGAPHAQLKGWEAICHYDPYLSDTELAAPIIVVGSEHDQIAPLASTSYLAAQLPQAKHLVINGAGHASFLDQRDALVELINDLTREEDPVPPESEVSEEILTETETDTSEIDTVEASLSME